MQWKTSISRADDKESLVRGYELMELVENLTFSQAIFLVLKGELPTKEQARMMDAILVAPIEHGVSVPSTYSSRVSISTGQPLNAAIAAGILSIGEFHGGAIEQAAKLYQENSGKGGKQIIEEYSKAGKRVPGYGHKIYKESDPRAQTLFRIAKETKIFGNYCQLALDIEKEFKKIGKPLPLNIDGAIAALISEMGFDWRLGKAFFIIPRVVGMAAHAHEEMTKEKPFRRFEENEIVYEGPQKRELPKEYRRK